MTKRDKTVFSVVLLLLLFMLLFSLCVGSYPLSPKDIFSVLFGGGEVMQRRVFFSLRLPRVLAALLCGAVLGCAGAVYQMLFESPLASPDLTGVSSAASLGAAAAITLGLGTVGRIGLAFLGGLASLAVVLVIVFAARGRGTYRCILAGVIVSSAANAGLMLLKATTDREGTLSSVEHWTMGSLSGMTDDKLIAAAAAAFPALIILWILERAASVLSLGSEQAGTLGISPERYRALLLCLSTLAVSAVVSVSGTVGFMGLIAPHIAYLLRGKRGHGFLGLSSLVGALLMLSADLLARGLFPGKELPLSVFTVVFALPVLCILLFAGGGKTDADI